MMAFDWAFKKLATNWKTDGVVTNFIKYVLRALVRLLTEDPF